MNETVKIKFVSALEEYINTHLKQIKHKDRQLFEVRNLSIAQKN